MEQKKKTTHLNGFTEILLVLGVINSIARIILSFISIAEEDITIGAGLYDIIASVFVAYFIIKLLQANKIGLYGYFVMIGINIVASLYFCDGYYSAVMHQLTVNIFQVAILLACLFFLKSDGISGWDAIFCKDMSHEDNVTPISK